MTHCKRGHALSGRNLMVFRRRGGQEHRQCRECKNLANSALRRGLTVAQFLEERA